MAFRNNAPTGGGGGGGVSLSSGIPTKAVEIGDGFEKGNSGQYADAHHQHAQPGPDAGSAQSLAATSSDSDASDTAPARSRHTHAHTASMHGPGGHADLSGTFSTFTAGDSRWASLVHGGRHMPGQPDDLSGVFVPVSLVNAAGDLLVGSANDVMVRLPAALSNDLILQSDLATPEKMKWAPFPAQTVNAYDPAVVALRKALGNDGIDLSYGTGVATVATSSTLLVQPLRAQVAGYIYTFSSSSTVSFTRPGSGSRLDSLVIRVDNANGGPANATLTVKTGTTSNYPTMQQDDLASGPTAIYELELFRLSVPFDASNPIITDVRAIGKGVDGQTGSVVKLGETTLSGSTSNITFSDIPQSFRDLEARFSCRSTNAVEFAALRARINTDTTTSRYEWEVIQGDAASVTGAYTASGTQPNGLMGLIPGTNVTTGGSGVGVVTFPNYALRGSNRQLWLAESTVDVGRSVAHVIAGRYSGSVPINNLRFMSDVSSLLSGSSIAIYGIR